MRKRSSPNAIQILPDIETEAAMDMLPAHGAAPYVKRGILHIRTYGLFTPRDFDVSPYFTIIKPAIEANFDYRTLPWSAD